MEIEHYRGPKKPELPATKKTLPTLQCLTSITISLSRAQETNFAFLQDVITAEKCPKFGLCCEVLRPSQQRQTYYCHKDSKKADSNNNILCTIKGLFHGMGN